MADNIKPFFTYVNDNDIDSFLENSNQYINNVSFLGTSYQIVAKNKIYGNVRSDWNENDNSKQSYIIGKPDVVEKSYFDSAYSYILEEIYKNEYVTAYGLIQLNEKIDNYEPDLTTYAPKTWFNTYAPKTWISAYVKTSDLEAQGYLTAQDLTPYISKTELESQAYATSANVFNNYTSYTYIEQRLGNIDLSTYVSKTELDNQAYATKTYTAETYPTYTYIYTYIEQRLGSIDLTNYVSKIELTNESYLSSTYFDDAYTDIRTRLTTLELNSGNGGSGTTAEGGITSIVFNGTAASISGSVATITSPIYDSQITLQMNNATVDTFTVNTQSNKTINLGNVVVPNDLNNYVSKTELNNAGYITSGLPSVTSSDNGKILMVVNGVWTLISPATIYSGNATPSNANGNNGDIYIQS